MKQYLILILVFGITCVSCSTEYKLKNYSGPYAMDNAEVLEASKRCINNKLRPDVQYISVKTDSGSKVLVPIDVHCEPYLR